MQRLLSVSVSVFAASLMLSSPAAADPAFFSTMLCESSAKGNVRIRNNGDVTFNIRGLTPDTDYDCLVSCGGNFLELSDLVTCSTNADGRLNQKFPGLGLSGDLVNGCLLPVPIVSGDTFCAPGYGSPSF